MLAFVFANRLGGSVGRVGGGGAFAFHPLLDTVCYRPMPDLSRRAGRGDHALLVGAHARAKPRTLGALRGADRRGRFRHRGERVTGVSSCR